MGTSMYVVVTLSFGSDDSWLLKQAKGMLPGFLLPTNAKPQHEFATAHLNRNSSSVLDYGEY